MFFVRTHICITSSIAPLKVANSSPMVGISNVRSKPVGGEEVQNVIVAVWLS